MTSSGKKIIGNCALIVFFCLAYTPHIIGNELKCPENVQDVLMAYSKSVDKDTLIINDKTWHINQKNNLLKKKKLEKLSKLSRLRTRDTSICSYAGYSKDNVFMAPVLELSDKPFSKKGNKLRRFAGKAFGK